MKIITQLVILTLSLANVYADDQYCSKLIDDFKNNCTGSPPGISSCCDFRTFLASGVYKTSKGTFDKSAETYCDMVTDGGGWIVIQRNKRSSSVSFDRPWTDYERGFGDLNTEFWYGLEEIHCLTQRGHWEMRLDIQKTDKTWTYLHYNNFSVGSGNDEYPLSIGGFTGVGTNWFHYSTNNGANAHGSKFSSTDNDNDKHTSYNCADGYNHGWWHNACTYVRINWQPPYMQGHGYLLFTEMKIRSMNCTI